MLQQSVVPEGAFATSCCCRVLSQGSCPSLKLHRSKRGMTITRRRFWLLSLSCNFSVPKYFMYSSRSFKLSCMDGQVEYPGVQDNVGQTLSCPNEKDCEPSQDLSKQIRVCVWGVSHVSHDLSRATQKLILTGRRENPRPARDASRSAAVEVGRRSNRRNDRKTKVRGSGLGMFKFVSTSTFKGVPNEFQELGFLRGA